MQAGGNQQGCENEQGSASPREKLAEWFEPFCQLLCFGEAGMAENDEEGGDKLQYLSDNRLARAER